MVRFGIGLFAPLAWIMAYVLTFERTTRRSAAKWALSVALLTLAAWTLAPHESIRIVKFQPARAIWGAGVMAALSLQRLWSKPRRAKLRKRCLHCGHDLFGNQSGICPECGRPTPGDRDRNRRRLNQPFAAALKQMSRIA